MQFERYGDVEFIASHLHRAVDGVGDLRSAFDNQHQVDGLLPICMEFDGDVRGGVGGQVDIVRCGLQREGDLFCEFDGCLEVVCFEGEAVRVVGG